MPDAKYCPREPTTEMLAAVDPVLDELMHTGRPCGDAEIWRAMYDAAPAQAEPLPLDPDLRRLRLTAIDALTEMANDDPHEWTGVRSLAREVIRYADRVKQAPAQAEPREPTSMDYGNHLEHDAPAAEDGLVGQLRAWQDLAGWADGGWELLPKATEALNRVTDRAAARIERQAQEIAAAERTMGDLAMMLLQNDREGAKDWARGVKVTFPDGAPRVPILSLTEARNLDAALRRAEAADAALAWVMRTHVRDLAIIDPLHKGAINAALASPAETK